MPCLLVAAPWQVAWRLLEKRFPWMTCTPCGTHVLSLLLKDMAKLPDIAALIAKVHTVLSLFWGRKRWPRKRLRETIAANHGGKQFGLYRAKQTRFAGTPPLSLSFPPLALSYIALMHCAERCTGKFREMSRMLRVKCDLQQVVISADYSKQKFGKRGAQAEDGEELDPDIGAKVKTIVLDETGFWRAMTEVLFIAMPIIKLLRMLDSNQLCLGKVYHRMYSVEQKLMKAVGTISWASEMLAIHRERWEYLHSPFHAAAYALDPEYLQTVGDLDEATQDGVLKVIERMCLRDAMMAAGGGEEAMSTLTLESPEVVERVAQAEREWATFQERDGAFSRPTVLLNAKSMEPSKWWSTYGRHLPLLSSIASRVTSQPGAASWAERNWSVYGQVKSANKARMKHRTADKLVYSKETLYLQDKLQDAGWKPDVVAHEELTDTDSDTDH